MVIRQETKMLELASFLESRRLMLTMGRSRAGAVLVRLQSTGTADVIQGFGVNLFAAVQDAFEQLAVVEPSW